MLHRYWFDFNITPNQLSEYATYAGFSYGCGVTAYSLEDALQVLRQSVFGSDPLPEVAKVVEDVDVSSLDKGHVLPNMGNPTSRGVWFPIGFA